MPKELKELFPYEYIGGGYFREKKKKKGEKAKCLHGMEAIYELYRQMKIYHFLDTKL